MKLSHVRSVFSWVAIAASCALANAQTVYVTTAADVIDFTGAQTVANLPGPDGRVSLAEAGIASDNTPGVQTIGFHVPQNEWTYQWLYPGRAVLQVFLGFRVFDTVILDATTQTAFTGETNPEGGGEVVLWSETYLIDNVGSVVTGFDNTVISVSGGSHNVIRGNTKVGIEVYDSPFSIVGGANPGDGNTAGTIKIDRSHDNVIVGNTAQRVRVLGWVGGGKPAQNIRVGGPTLGERNYITGYGTWNSEGYPGGTTVQVFDSIGVVIENNWIGTTPDGLAQGSLASTQGVGFEGENHDALVKNNRIAGILGHGIGPHYAGWLVGSAIDIDGVGSGITLLGNSIGLDANDAPVLGSVTGISTRNYYLGTVSNLVLGGTGPGEGNEIAGHLGVGVSVAGQYSRVRITGNSIHDNGGLGIDLVTTNFQTGVTPNDALDLDLGGNGLQNYPVLQSAGVVGPSLRVVGSLNSTANTAFTLDFYASPQCDSSGFGEGRQYVGSSVVQTAANGTVGFDITLTALVVPGSFVTATATTTDGSTSEFSACVASTGSAFAWTDFGNGLAGTTGLPHLIGSGNLAAGSMLHWTMSNARPSANGFLVIGFSQIHLPFAGGVIVPAPDIVLPIVTNSLGQTVLDLFVPSAPPSGVTVTTQIWIVDPIGVAGFAASNAIAASAP